MDGGVGRFRASRGRREGGVEPSESRGEPGIKRLRGDHFGKVIEENLYDGGDIGGGAIRANACEGNNCG